MIQIKDICIFKATAYFKVS